MCSERYHQRGVTLRIRHALRLLEIVPSIFDHPFTTTRGIHWTADAFLVVSPDAVMTRVVQPVCGFTWGYSTEGEETRALLLTRIDPAAWSAACAILRPRYPQWEFREEWVSE